MSGGGASRARPELRLEELRGAAIEPRVPALAALRIAVFREWPYLYAGTRDYEAHYLEAYWRCPRGYAALAWDGTQCVGATTALPLGEASAEWQAPFRKAGRTLDEIFYFGESVLLPAYRGRGLGVRFFELREAEARGLGLKVCAFCAVQRADDDPRKPADATSNEDFWRKRGYVRDEGLVTTFLWPDLGEPEATPKPMQFWTRRLEPA